MGFVRFLLLFAALARCVSIVMLRFSERINPSSFHVVGSQWLMCAVNITRFIALYGSYYSKLLHLR
jgi:hypothetical protein